MTPLSEFCERFNLNVCFYLATQDVLQAEAAGKWLLIEDGHVVDMGDAEEELLPRRESEASIVLYIPRLAGVDFAA